MPLDATGYLPQRVLTPDEARDLAILKTARHRIRHRWRWWDGGSSLWCLVPAIFGGTCAMLAVTRETSGNEDDRFAALRRLAAHLPPGWSVIHLYNDDPLTTHADILSLYDRAIAELE
jgi:hypothetical protein